MKFNEKKRRKELIRLLEILKNKQEETWGVLDGDGQWFIRRPDKEEKTRMNKMVSYDHNYQYYVETYASGECWLWRKKTNG